MEVLSCALTQHAESFRDVMTDWPNLLQGAIGSVVGAVLGILGAFWAAKRTIAGQFAAERALAREAAGAQAARSAVERLRHSEQALLGLALAEHLGTGQPEAWKRLETANEEMLDEREVIDAQLPSHLIAALSELDRRTFALFEYFTMRIPVAEDWGRVGGRDSLTPVGRAAMYAHDQVVAAKTLFAHYRSDAGTKAKETKNAKAR